MPPPHPSSRYALRAVASPQSPALRPQGEGASYAALATGSTKGRHRLCKDEVIPEPRQRAPDYSQGSRAGAVLGARRLAA